jgi:hypothetical protein
VNKFFGVLVVAWLSLHQPGAGAQGNPVLEQLQKTATADDYAQVQSAIDASPSIQADLKQLVSEGKLMEILVKPRSQCPGCQFGGFENNGRIIFTREFLQALKRNRLWDVVYADDIPPNNTVFALAHLIHHIRNPVDMGKFNNPTDFSDARMLVEAECFLRAWNAMVEVAEIANGNQPLSRRQTGQLLVNSRYQFPFIGKSQPSGERLEWLADGRFAIDAKNKKIVADVLVNSRMADLR